jgi:hypothetical protein
MFYNFSTYYCGKIKPKTCFILTKTTPDHPSCVPEIGGLQCIACKMAQDLAQVSETSQTNCHVLFKKNFRHWFKDANPIGSEDTVFRNGYNIKICNGKLNPNQASKTILTTAIEMIQAHCDKAGSMYTLENISSPDISYSEASVVVNMMYGQSHNIHLIIECKTTPAEGRQRVHTQLFYACQTHHSTC